MTDKFDVIIIGSGPAGSMAAHTLAEKGIKPLILEKEVLPRYKVCGGALQHKILELLPFDISPIVESKIYNVEFSYRFKNVIHRESNLPLMYCIMRDRFDEYLVNKALEKGAVLHEDQQVKLVSFIDNKYIIHTDERQYECDVLVGADGANSIVAKSLNLMTDAKKSLGIQYEVSIDNENMLIGRDNQTIMLDWGTLPSGYAWLFPKADLYSVGAGGPLTIGKALKPYLKKFCEYKRVNHNASVIFRGHILPTRSLDSNVVKDRVILVGDAAGLVDPFTGEGIYQAIYSGQIAASIIYDFLSGKINSLNRYENSVNNLIYEEIMATQLIMNLFSVASYTAHNSIKYDRVWSAFCRILRGEKTFSSITDRLGVFAKPIEAIASYKSNKKLLHYKASAIEEL